MTETQFYTTRLQAGLGLVEETVVLLGLYTPGMSARELYEAALDSGQFPTMTARRLLNLVKEGFAPRYLYDLEATIALQRLIGECQRTELLQLFLLHTVRANLILQGFIEEVFWPRYSAGVDQITRDDALSFVHTAVREGKTERPWSQSTIQRVASYLLGTCADFGLLSGNRGGARSIQPLRVHLRTAAYLAYDLKSRGLGDNQILAHRDWRLLGMERADVQAQFKQLALAGYVIVQSAGEVTQITWKYKTLGEMVDVLVGH